MTTTAQTYTVGPKIEQIIDEIYKKAGDRAYTFMEVCGTHTMAIARYALKKKLPQNIRLLSGPGCPVCVTSAGYIDLAIELSRQEDIIITTFGDMVRVPGSSSSLKNEVSKGADVRIVYSVEKALDIALRNPKKQTIFLGVGFETTAPSTAVAIRTAQSQNISNFFVLSAHKVMQPALEYLLSDGKVLIDGFICPGHVSVIMGEEPYLRIPELYNKACVISGFEPLDILESVSMLIDQVNSDNPSIENQYKRAVHPDGNSKAKKIMHEVFKPCDAVWRGIGTITNSGLAIRNFYLNYDAHRRFPVTMETPKTHNGCICGLILQGLKQPPDCPLFNSICTPDNPVGPCMVSHEGACAAYFNYHQQ